MFNAVDLMWVEYRGMSIISALFFVGFFGCVFALFWWIRKELDSINTIVANHGVRLNANQKELSQLTTQIAIIRTVVENTEKAVNKLVDKVYK